MERKFLLSGLIFGLFAVIFGAFGAHALKELLSSEQLLSFETGIRYQFYHSFLLIAISCKARLCTKSIYMLIIAGILLFSGSIYLLNIREVVGADWLKVLGPVTPVGGLLLIIAWVSLIIRASKDLKA